MGSVELHRTKRLAREDVTRLRTIPITTAARTLVDLAAVLRPHALERAVNQAEVLQLLDVRAVHAAMQRAPGRAGTRRLAQILSAPSPTSTPAAG